MSINDVYDLAKDIVSKANDLKNKYTDEINAKVSYACIFCKNDEDYNSYIEVLNTDFRTRVTGSGVVHFIVLRGLIGLFDV